MTLAFERSLAPPRWLRPLRAAAAAAGLCGAALGVAQAHARWGLPGAAGLAAAVMVALAATLLLRHRRRAQPPGCVLRVDAHGRARLRIDGREFDCVPQRWLLADGWVALTVRIEPPAGARPRRLDLVSGAQPPDDSWRRLRAWLTWLRRGSVPHGAFGSDG